MLKYNSTEENEEEKKHTHTHRIKRDFINE